MLLTSRPEALHGVHLVRGASYKHEMQLEMAVLRKLEQFLAPVYPFALAAMELCMVRKLVVQ